MSESKQFILTFGHGQEHFGKFHRIFAKDNDAAREEAFRRFGQKWSMMYATEEEAGVSRFGLTELK